MKTVFKHNSVSILALLIVMGASLSAVLAQTSVPGAQSAAPNSTSTSSIPANNSAAISPALQPLPLPNAPKETDTNTALDKLENKVPDSVKEVVSHLDKTGSEVTLEDLNSARQAVAKIEALIDIEKHLAELDKIRQERDKITSFAGAIPAGALRPPSGGHPSMANSGPAMPPPPVQKIDQDTEVVRIIGKNGRYEATLKTSAEKPIPVKVGDRLSDGTKIVSIEASQVTILRDGKPHTLRVKNINAVFGNTL
jgi:type IV pilus biogenesis protein PilP